MGNCKIFKTKQCERSYLLLISRDGLSSHLIVCSGLEVFIIYLLTIYFHGFMWRSRTFPTKIFELMVKVNAMILKENFSFFRKILLWSAESYLTTRSIQWVWDLVSCFCRAQTQQLLLRPTKACHLIPNPFYNIKSSNMKAQILYINP